jgi:beta-lactamase superfamily II metal-dependent hydrolase
MSNYFQIDFMDAEAKKSGDAIPLRYELDGVTYIHVVDGGFQATGECVVEHIKNHYGSPKKIDHVVVTHSDQDHAGGLRTVLESFDVGTLWMLRPWLYAEELIDRFKRFTSVENLKARLRELYPAIVALEDIANERKIPIAAPFQGAAIGAFTVMAPTKSRYLDMVVESDKTPEAVEEKSAAATALSTFFQEAVAFLRAAWGEEKFPEEGTSCENEMSVVQYANLCGQKILLTGDAGRGAMKEASAYAPTVGLTLPGIDRFQTPHHGARRNVSTEVLDTWLGARLATKPARGQETFTAFISSAMADPDHPRKSVIRALVHRGAAVHTTEGRTVCTSQNLQRPGWSAAPVEDYPEEQED